MHDDFGTTIEYPRRQGETKRIEKEGQEGSQATQTDNMGVRNVGSSPVATKLRCQDREPLSEHRPCNAETAVRDSVQLDTGQSGREEDRPRRGRQRRAPSPPGGTRNHTVRGSFSGLGSAT